MHFSSRLAVHVHQMFSEQFTTKMIDKLFARLYKQQQQQQQHVGQQQRQVLAKVHSVGGIALAVAISWLLPKFEPTAKLTVC